MNIYAYICMYMYICIQRTCSACALLLSSASTASRRLGDTSSTPPASATLSIP